MYIKKTTGNVIATQADNSHPHERTCDNHPYRIVKSGRVLALQEERASFLQKSADIDSIANQGFVYYQVIGNPDCKTCSEHSGAIYPVAEGKEGVTLPPFHPNCDCTTQGFSTENPNHDPWLGETIFWLDIMYGDGSMEHKAQKLLDFYHWTDFSVGFIAGILTKIADIKHVGRRTEEFFSLLDKRNNDAPAQVTPKDLERFGWHAATQDEANRLTAAFAKFGITSRESMIQFIAIAAAESGGGKWNLEGQWLTEEALMRYLENKDYDRYERGAGYIQITWRQTHLDFLEFMGDDFDGEDTASYIAENYPLEASIWYWTIYGSPYTGGVNEFIETKMDEGGNPLLVFLKTSYYVGGMPSGSFNSDINDAIVGKADYEISDTHLIINDNSYLLPDRWDVRLEAYEKAQTIW